MDDKLVDPFSAQFVPAPVLLERLLTYLQPRLEQSGDWEEVVTLLKQLQHGGTSAQRQRAAIRRTGRLEDVVELLVAETRSW